MVFTLEFYLRNQRNVFFCFVNLCAIFQNPKRIAVVYGVRKDDLGKVRQSFYYSLIELVPSGSDVI